MNLIIKIFLSPPFICFCLLIIFDLTHPPVSRAGPDCCSQDRGSRDSAFTDWRLPNIVISVLVKWTGRRCLASCCKCWPSVGCTAGVLGDWQPLGTCRPAGRRAARHAVSAPSRPMRRRGGGWTRRWTEPEAADKRWSARVQAPHWAN